MPKTTLRLALLAALFLITSCSDVGDFKGGDQGASQDMTASMEDMESADADLSSGEDMSRVDEEMGETCTPQTKVSVCMAVCGEQPDGCGGTYDCGEAREEAEVCAEACGSQPDGCGGTIECEPCACEDGQPVQPTCGPCNLGTASCDEQDNLLCQLPPVPDIETLNCELDVIYVSNTYTGTSRLGTKAAPFKTIVDGLSAGVSNTARLVVATNTERYEEDSALVIGSGTSFIGGYSADWQYTPETKTEVTVAPGSEDTVGISATSISLPTAVANVDLETSPSANNGNNYGIYANTANRLIIDNVVIVAGKGGGGEDGTQGGGIALPGKDGAEGLPGQTKPNELFAAYDCPTSADLITGTPTSFKCIESYTLGGKGGSGGCTNTPPTTGSKSNANVDGGYTGKQTTPNGGHGTTASPWSKSHRGQEGSRGLRGGQIVEGKWIATGKGGTGDDGKNGRGGGGGGGAIMRDDPYASGAHGRQRWWRWMQRLWSRRRVSGRNLLRNVYYRHIWFGDSRCIAYQLLQWRRWRRWTNGRARRLGRLRRIGYRSSVCSDRWHQPTNHQLRDSWLQIRRWRRRD